MLNLQVGVNLFLMRVQGLSQIYQFLYEIVFQELLEYSVTYKKLVARSYDARN